MDDSLESDLLAGHVVPFGRDEATWTDRYVTLRSRLDPTASPPAISAAARAAWRSHGWAHPGVVAHLEHELGPLDRV
jgi:hypothetical protein